MKSGPARNPLAIIAVALLIGSICGFHSTIAAPDPAAAPLPTVNGPSQFELESHFFVVDDRDIQLMPDAVRNRLSAFDGRNANRTDQTLDEQEMKSFASSLKNELLVPENYPMKMREHESVRSLIEAQQAYVSSLTEIRAPGAALFDPQVSTLAARGSELTCSVSSRNNQAGISVSISAKVTRLVALVPITHSMKIEPLTAPGTFQTVSGTYQLPVISKYELQRGDLTVPDGKALLIAGFRQTIQNASSATTQPAITASNKGNISAEEHKRVYLLLKPRLVAIGVAPRKDDLEGI